MASRCSVVITLLVAVASVAYGQLVFRQDRTTTEKTPLFVEFDAQDQPVCPPLDGVYEDATFCDAYWKCNHGRATEIFCDDGLVFDSNKAHSADPCDTPHVVNCGSRQELQQPTFPNENCPRRHGTFEHPDPQVCNVYYQCVDAKPQEITCAVGLYFNSTQGSCNWPHISMRKGCVDKPLVSKDGAFTCPPGIFRNDIGVEVPHPSYANAEDCGKFYVCLNGVTPQAASCDKGLVFDERSMLCALPDTVPECAGWYANDPEFAHYYDELPAASRSDPGRFDIAG